MDPNYKKILYINLDSLEYEFKMHEDLVSYLGGIGVGYKLIADNLNSSPIILSAGPLSGYFPYVSKASLLYVDDGNLVEKFGGGTVASRMNMAELDSIVFLGNTKENIHITISQKEIGFSVEDIGTFNKRSSDFAMSKKNAFSQKYFSFGNFTQFPLRIKGKVSFDIDATEAVDFPDFYNYEDLYNTVLDDYKRLTVEPRNNPSCTGCPMGCDKSSEGEDDVNIAVLPRCLISCGYAEDIYKNIPFVYACLSSVGYNYQHEDLEKIPTLVGELKVKINELLNSELEAKQNS